MSAVVPPSIPSHAPGSPVRPVPERAGHAFEFSGTTADFFPIWIVNTLLILATLGVYAAWAKVRRKRYFYGHTRLLGCSFDYTAKPGALFIGNAIVVALLLASGVIGRVYPLIGILSLVVGGLALPWLVMRALRFNTRNTVHRGIAFRFVGSYGQACEPYLGWPILVPLTLGLVYPYQVLARVRYAINHLRFGNQPFHFSGSANAIYGIYVKAWLICLGLLVLSIAPTMLLVKLAPAEVAPWLTYIVSAGLLLIFTVTRTLIAAELFNFRWNHTELNGRRFAANLSFETLMKIYFSNAAAILCTLGLAIPWAMIRTTRYRLSCVQFLPATPLESVQADTDSGRGALGDAATEYFGVEVGL